MPEIQSSTFDVQPIELSKIDVWVGVNVRTDEITADIGDLAHSLDTIGLQQPIVVQEEDGRYKILVGQRRYLAAKRLGWAEIPARVVEGLDQPTAILWSISENIQRRDLTPRDKSNACKYLLDRFKSAAAVAAQIGSSERTVKKWLGYYHIVPEEMKRMVDEKRISSSTALRIAENVSDEEKAIAIA